MRKRYNWILLLPALVPSCSSVEPWLPTDLLTQPIVNPYTERISSYPSGSIIHHSLPGGESRDLMTSYPQQQIQLTPVEQPLQPAAVGRLQKSVFDTVAEPALIRTSLLEDRKDKAMQRRSFPAHIFDKISSIARKFMPKVNKKKPFHNGVRDMRNYGGYRKPQYAANTNSIVPMPSQPELTIPAADPPSEFTAIDTPIPGVFPPMGNGYETVIIIQSTDANQENFDSSKANGFTTESPTTTTTPQTNIIFPDFEDDTTTELTPEEEEIVEEYMDIIYDLINTRINSIDDGLEPDLSLDIDAPPNRRPTITPQPRTTPSTPNFVDYDGLLYPDFVLNVAAPQDSVQQFGPFATRSPPAPQTPSPSLTSLFDEEYPLYPDFVVQQPAPVDSRVRDRFPELRTDRPTRPDPILDYEDDLYPDFSVNFESSIEPQAAVRRPQFVPQSVDDDLVPDFSVNIDVLDENVRLTTDENGNQVMVKTEVFPSADPEYVYEVEYEYTDDADLIPDFQLTELDQKNQLKKRVKMKNVDVLGLLQKQPQFSFANLISPNLPVSSTAPAQSKLRRKNKFQRQKKKKTPYQKFLETRFERLEHEKQAEVPGTNDLQTTSRKPKAQEQHSASDYMFSWGTETRESVNMTWTEARMYCRKMGRTVISMDDPKLMKRIMRFMKQIGVERIWVGGRVGRSKHGVFWENGVTQAISRGEFPWAANGRRGSQPDGDDQHREDCVALVYKTQEITGLHDASCQVRLPTACQLPAKS